MLKLFKYIINKNNLDELTLPEKSFIQAYGHKFDFTTSGMGLLEYLSK